MTGVFAVSRGVFDHPSFAPEPYTEREAWLWLIGDAAWKPHKRRAGRVVVDLKRGQTAHATRFLATKWKWSEARVRRFLNRLKIDAMVELQATRETTHITICNYDKYAFDRRTSDAPSDAQTDAPATHERRRVEEGKKDKKEKEDIQAVAKATRPDIEKSFSEFWAKYPKRNGDNPRKSALKAYTAAVHRGSKPEDILAGLERWIAKNQSKIGTSYVPQAVKWLHDERWRDALAEHAADTAPIKAKSLLPGSPEFEKLFSSVDPKSFQHSLMVRSKDTSQPYYPPPELLASLETSQGS